MRIVAVVVVVVVVVAVVVVVFVKYYVGLNVVAVDCSGSSWEPAFGPCV